MRSEVASLTCELRFTINNITYTEPKVPSLYTALSVGKDATNPIVYGHAANAHVVDYYDTVEVVVNNFDTGGHPLHLHGHNFQIVQRSATNAGVYGGTPIDPPATPIRRDVVKVNAGGYVTFRFIANNPDKYPLSPICTPTPSLTKSLHVSGHSTAT